MKRQLKKKKDNLLLSFKQDPDFADNLYNLPSPNNKNSRYIKNSPDSRNF